MTREAGLPGATAGAITALKPTEVVVLGGEAAVSEDVVTELEATGATVTRIGGQDRYETAALLADFEAPVARAYVASGLDYPDALTGAATAGALDSPILLTRPTALSQVTGEKLAGLEPTRIFVLGGVAAVAEDVLDSLGQFLP